MSRPPLTSLQNPRVKAALSLRDRRARDRERLTLIEGYHELTLALDSGVRPIEVFYCPALIDEAAQARLLRALEAAGARLIEVDRRVFDRLAYRENPDGWLAVAPVPGRMLSEVRLGPNPLLMVTEAVEKPGNLGAILRTADAAGIDALIACDPLTDWGNPNVIRASKGTVFSVPVATAPSAAAITWLRQHGIRIVAATPAAETIYHAADLRGPVALTVGTEKHGLSRAWLDAADTAVRVPMHGKADSLNVATVAALLIYEALRQRA